MTFSSFLTRATAALALTLSAGAVLAVPVTFSFKAEITSAELLDIDTLLYTTNFTLLPSEGKGVGDIFSGTFSYDTDAPAHPGNPSTPGERHWYKDEGPNQGTQFRNQDGSVVLSSQTSPFAWIGTSLAVDNGSTWGFSHFGVHLPPLGNGSTEAHFIFIDFSRQTLQDLLIPSDLNLQDYDTAWFDLKFHRDGGGWVSVHGNVIDLSAVQTSEVPEPAGIFTLALVAAGVFARRKMPR